MKTQTIMFGMGCFWGVQDIFDKRKGVVETTVGYAGGTKENPTYEEVCSGSTGHTEVVLVEYNDDITTEELVKLFFSSHNPEAETKKQYRSVIFYYSNEQKEIAEKLKKYSYKTEIAKAPVFYKAEDYHQKYFQKNNIKTCHA